MEAQSGSAAVMQGSQAGAVAQEPALGDPRVQPPTKRAEFWAGVRATLPMVVGGIPFGIIFGAVAVTSGLSAQAAAAMSAFVFAGSAQFIAAGMVAGGAGIPIIVLTTLIVNLRHSLYSVSLSPYMSRLPHKWLVPLGFWLTDESYLVVIDRYQRPDSSPFKHWYFLGSAIFMYVSWQICTWIGIFAGRTIPNPQAWGLDFALPVTFIGMLVTGIHKRSTLACVLAAGAAAVALAGLPNQLGLIIAAFVGIGAGTLTLRWGRSTQ